MDETMTQYSPVLGKVLAGRERELVTLWDCYLAAREGRANVVLVGGEPGIGKSRLLAEAAARAGAAGAIVLRGGASEAAGMPPYLPFLEALGSYIRATEPERLRNQTGAEAAALASILPELAVRLGELPASYPLPVEQARLRLFEAVSTFLGAIAADSPVVLILDDLQWADVATLDLLVHVARRAVSARALIAGGYRAADTASNAALSRALTELNRLRVLTTVSLAPLSEMEIGTLAGEFLGEPAPLPVRRVLHAQSEGNPFFAEELMRHWLASGVLQRLKGGWSMRDVMPAPPPTIVEAVRQRLTAFPAELVDLLRSAAILGRAFTVDLLAEVVGRDEAEVDDALVVAVRAGLLRSRPDGYEFAHDKVRETLYDEVSMVRRRRLHGFIGRALEQRGEESAGALAALAYHFVRSGDSARGVTYGERAARQALASFAPDEARTHLQSALDLLPALDERRGRLLLAFGEAALLSGAERDAIGAFAEAERWFRERGSSLDAARAAHKRGQSLWRLEAVVEAQTAFDDALTLLGEDRPPEWVDVKVDLGTLLAISRNQSDAGITHAQEALMLADRLGDDRRSAAAYRAVGNLLVRANRIAEGRPLLERAYALAEAADDPTEAAECCSCLLVADYWSGNAEGIREAAQRQIAAAERGHDLYQLRHVYVWLAGYYAYTGQRTASERAIASAREMVDRLDLPDSRAFLEQMLGLIALWQGDTDAAERHLSTTVEIYRGLNPDAATWYLGMLALAQFANGSRDEALATLSAAERALEGLAPDSVVIPELVVPLAPIVVILGDHGRAERYLRLLTPFAGRLATHLVDHARAQLALLLGDWVTVEAALDAGETTARRGGLMHELALSLVLRADLLLARGEAKSAARVRELLAEAEQIYRNLGAVARAHQIGTRLTALGSTRRPSVAPTLPAGLSEREAEVLRLAAAGRTNREIANALFISEKTVANHLTSIFAKTGVDNRVEATAFAIRHGLIT
jgi:DNA-binding CsgD family transcriptional regulator